MGFAEYEKYDGLGLAELVARREVSAEELLAAALERVERRNPKINAVILLCAESAREAIRAGLPEGRFRGVPFLLKDLHATLAGEHITFGSRIYRDFVADHDAELTARYKRAGLVIFGRTTSPEFGLTGTTESLLWGKTRNPWSLELSSGGSSGGAAAAVAAGILPVAHASDGGGSIRIPASFCGIFGIKPTYGRVPRNPGGWSTFTHRGPMARTVADAALMLDVMAGHEPADPFTVADYPGSFLAEVEGGVRGLRVAWSADLGYALVEPEVRAVCERAARRFEELGCTVEEAHPGFANPNLDRTFIILAATGDALWLSALTDEQREQVGATAKQFLEYGGRVSGADYLRANERRMAIWHATQRFHETYDLLLTPTLSVTAFPVGEPPPQIDGSNYAPLAWSPFTAPFNLTGQPAASVPCGFDAQGLPVGLHIVGRAYEDALVLRAARAFEQLQPWAEVHPPLDALMAT